MCVLLVCLPKLMDLLTVETLKLEQLEEEEDNQSTQKTITNNNISFPDEIIEEIILRLPVKPILRFTSVSKQWLSFISDDPSFPERHFNHSRVTDDRTSFFMSAYDTSTNQRHFLSAPRDGGPVTHLITLHNAPQSYGGRHETAEAEHLNGLVFFTSRNAPFDSENFAFVVNPATRKVFKVPPPPLLYIDLYHSTYFFGFDESENEHKILSRSFCTLNPEIIEFMIFSLSTYSWRHVLVDLEEVPTVLDTVGLFKNSVCVNSVIHLMLSIIYKILAFDLTTEKFSVIDLPQGAIPLELDTEFNWQGKRILKGNEPFLIKDNGLLGVVCHDLVVETNEMHIWILQDYVNRVWVRETITCSESWIDIDGLETLDYLDMADLVFSCPRLSRDMVNAFILDRRTKSFKLVNFNLGYRFLHSDTVKFHQVKSYVESILPLRED